jgi:hypothetical protein
MTCSAIGDKRDYSIDNDAMQAFESELLDEKWMETVENELHSMNDGKFGRPFRFSDSVIEWGMMYRAAEKKNYRRAAGALNCRLRKSGYPEISLTQFYDRAQSFAERKMDLDMTDTRVLAYGTGEIEADDMKVEAAVDSTGMSLNKYGGWMRHFWNTETVSGWIKVHVVVNVHTGEILAYVVTDENCVDVTCMERLIDAAKGAGHDITGIFADAAYDKIELWKKYGSEGIEYRVNIKSPLIKKYAGGRVRANGCPLRAAHIRMIIEIGRDAWKKEIGYGMRWKVECAFSDMKRMFGDVMRSRVRHRMAAEIYWIIRCHNMYKSIRRAFATGRGYGI